MYLDAVNVTALLIAKTVPDHAPETTTGNLAGGFINFEIAVSALAFTTTCYILE